MITRRKWLPASADNRIDANAIRTQANMIAELGWHIQIHARADQLVQHAALLRDLPVDVVIDHSGQIDPRDGENQEGGPGDVGPARDRKMLDQADRLPIASSGRQGRRDGAVPAALRGGRGGALPLWQTTGRIR